MITRKSPRKIPRESVAGVKLAAQFILAAIVVAVFLSNPHNAMFSMDLYVPFLKKALIPNMGIYAFGLIAFLFYGFVIVGCSNAVNLTDGLDGLAAGCTVTVAGAYAAIDLCVQQSAGDYGTWIFPFTPGSGELTVLCSALAGAGPRASYGSTPIRHRCSWATLARLAIGGFIAIIAICCKQELLLTISRRSFCHGSRHLSSSRWLSFKLTGKRVFAMSPLAPSLRIDRLEGNHGGGPFLDYF